jgi:hypothetical protein
MEKSTIVYVVLLLIVGVSLVVSSTPTNVTTLAILETKQVALKATQNLRIDIEDRPYTLTALSVARDRSNANLVLRSDAHPDSLFIQQYITLDMGPSSAPINFRESKQGYFRTEKSKTIYLGDKQLYIELMFIKNRAANLIIKQISKQEKIELTIIPQTRDSKEEVIPKENILEKPSVESIAQLPNGKSSKSTSYIGMLASIIVAIILLIFFINLLKPKKEKISRKKKPRKKRKKKKK